MTFPPALAHGPLIRVAPGVMAVRGRFRMGPGLTIGRTMTVLDGGSGLVVVNAIRLSDAGQGELDALGKVTHLVKLSDSHFVDEPFYIDRYAPTVWELDGARQRRAASTLLAGEGPITGGAVLDFAGATGWRECSYWVPLGGGTLVACDAIQNCGDADGRSVMSRLIMPVLGFKGGVIQPKMWRRLQKVASSRMPAILSGVTPLAFENLVTGHGAPVVGRADVQVRAAIEHAAR